MNERVNEWKHVCLHCGFVSASWGLEKQGAEVACRVGQKVSFKLLFICSPNINRFSFFLNRLIVLLMKIRTRFCDLFFDLPCACTDISDVTRCHSVLWSTDYRTITRAADQWSSLCCSVFDQLYTVSQNTVQNCFCHKFVKCLPNLIIFGTQIAQRIGLREVYVRCTHFFLKLNVTENY